MLATIKNWWNNWQHSLIILSVIIMAVMATVAVGGAIATLPFKFAIVIVVILLAIPAVLLAVENIVFGIGVAITIAFFIDFTRKFIDAPFGTALDGLLVLLTLGVLIKLVKNKDYSFLKNRITPWVIVWIYYNLAQVLNPWAVSKMAWVFTVRSVALLLLLFFVAAYALDNYKKIAGLFKWILMLGFLSALYSLKQEYFGFSSGELQWLHADEKRFMLIFQWSRLRVFSFFSDPTTFGILMAYLGVACFILATGPYRIGMRILSFLAGVSMMLGMAYAGSRTPFVLVPAAFMVYTIMTFRKESILVLGIVAIGIAGLVMKGSGNAVLFRIRSAFMPTADASVQVRLDNQALIQPFLRAHPIGAGLGSTGEWGRRFTPDSWLASFAHDSLYVRLAAETGWVGLILYMILMFQAFRTAVEYFFRSSEPKIKHLYLVFSVIIFTLMLANYPQEAVTLLPNSIIFYTLLGMVVRLHEFDQPDNLAQNKQR